MATSPDTIAKLLEQLNKLLTSRGASPLALDPDAMKDAAKYAKVLRDQIKEIQTFWDTIQGKIESSLDSMKGLGRVNETAKAAYERISSAAEDIKKHATEQTKLSATELNLKKAQILQDKKLVELALAKVAADSADADLLRTQLKLIDDLVGETNALIKEQRSLGAIFKNQTKELEKQVATQAENIKKTLSFSSILKFAYKQITDLSDKTYQNQINLGLSAKGAQTMTNNLRDASMSMKNVTFGEAVQSNQELNDQFGVSTQFSNKMVEAQQQMKDYLGLSGEEAAKLASYTVLTGKGQNDITKAIGKSGDKTLNQKKILQEVLKVEGQLAAQYKNDPAQLAKAVEQTTKLGMTLQQAANASRGLLNFEDSIANELEAELLTGKDLNLEKARYLALQGDSAGAAKEMMREVGGLADFQKMNVLQQDAMARAVGMTTDQLSDSLRKEEELENIKKKQGSAALTRIQELRDKGQVAEADQLQKALAEEKSLDVAEKELSISKQMAKNKEKIATALSSIFASPAVKVLGAILDKLAGLLTSPIVGTLLGLAGAAGAVIAGIAGVVAMGRSIKTMLFGKPGSSINNPMYTQEVGGGGAGAGGAAGLGKYARYAQMATAVAGIAATAYGSYMQSKAGETRQEAAQAKAAGNGAKAAELEKKAQSQETVGQSASQTGEKSLWSQALSWAGGKLKSVTKYVAKTATKLNPLARLRGMLSGAGGKLFKALAKIPYIGTFIETAMAAKDIAAMRASGASQDEIDQMVGKRVLQGIGGLLGSAGGTMLAGALTPFTGGASVLVQPLLAMGGDFVGRWLGGILADNVGAKPIGSMVNSLFGKTGTASPKKMDDGVVPAMSGYSRVLTGPQGSIALNDKDTIVSGTNLGGGGNQALVAEMRAIKAVLQQILQKEGDVTLDGVKVGTALNIATRKLQ
jgi:hypothetical protein